MLGAIESKLSVEQDPIFSVLCLPVWKIRFQAWRPPGTPATTTQMSVVDM